MPKPPASAPLTPKEHIQRTRRDELRAVAIEYDEAMCDGHRRDTRTGRCRYCGAVMP